MTDTIRKATLADTDAIMAIFAHARHFMKETNNPHQWINGYPSVELMQKEIESGHCYVIEDDTRKATATFCFIPGPDPTYDVIEEGSWLSNAPYHVIHRLASDGSRKGIAGLCIKWCSHTQGNLRADTHADNKIMQHLLEKNGFIRCGIIYVSNGTPRIAYERIGQARD